MTKQTKDIINTIIEAADRSGKALGVAQRYLLMKYKMIVDQAVLLSRLKKIKND